ncbi:MAG: tol-pal system YbgF family protein, partial [Candidatus Thorarchaeota archaeon]
MKKRVFAVVLLCAVIILSFPLHARADHDFDRAIELYSHGKFEEVIDILTVYVESKPEPAAYWLIGYSLYKLERFDEADKYFQDTYLIDPDFTPKKIEAFAPGLAEIDSEMKLKLEEFERKVTVPEEEGPLMPTFEPVPGVEGVAQPSVEGEQAPAMQQEPAEPAA